MTALRAAAGLAAATLLAGSVSAQTISGAPGAALEAGYDGGFFIQSAGGGYRLVIGALAQVDGRFSPDDPAPAVDTFTLRKLRPSLSGRVARFFDFKLMPDLAGGGSVVQDAYLDLRISPTLRVRTGKDKTPVGYEMLIGDAYVLFPERSLANSLVPNRDLGVALQGDLGTGFHYAAGLYNGVPDGGSSTDDRDTNDGKELAGRVVIRPFRLAGSAARALGGLGFQLGASRGAQEGALPGLKTSLGQTYFAYAPGIAARGQHSRFTPAAFYYRGPFGAFFEWVRSAQRLSAPGGRRAAAANTAWDVTGSYVLTGETGADRGVQPDAPFDPETGAPGALQAMARYAGLRVDEAVFAAGLAAPDASRTASQFSVGLNWYPNAQVKYTAAFERVGFGGGAAPRPVEHSLILRAQLAF
ncbi:MAG: porin [Acidobacteria bacterium]|nr:porin [Acidobacteriota bacterium]